MSDANCWYVVVNPVSGGGRARRYWPQLRMALDRMRVPYRSTESTAAGVASETVAGALQDGHRHFLAVGGDGSFHQLINGLMSQQQPPLPGLLCGVAPVGSGNDWARALAVPTDPAQLATVMSDCCHPARSTPPKAYCASAALRPASRRSTSVTLRAALAATPRQDQDAE
jgi:diacylglycerol kinase family enzyme